MRKGLNLLISSGLLLAIATALLYCVAIAYHNGYLETLGLNIYVLERSFNLTLYSGFLLASNSIVLVVQCLLFILACLIFLIILLLINKIFNFKLINSFIQACKQPQQETQKKEPHLTRVDYYGSIALKGLKYLFFVLFIYLLIMIALLISEKKGEETAQAVLKILENPAAIKGSRLITAWVREEKLKLYYLDCGSSFCAGIDPNTREVYYFPKDQFTYILDPIEQEKNHS